MKMHIAGLFVIVALAFSNEGSLHAKSQKTVANYCPCNDCIYLCGPDTGLGHP